MKKIFLLAFLMFATSFAYAIPGGCYSGTSRSHRDRCAILIQNNIIHITNRDGEVIARWNIVSEKDGVLSLKSEYGATASATWWEEDGNIYLNFNYETFTRMNN